ncbi:TIGR03767 family metallophosphoesterase [Goekera deserti]|uniref:TIGR03767 family metallophosphoesterase n=1 Tax=Goekera deserti TaxID=2497753 RepID=A0A7K3WG20_9ACTN|nr:TIGR03767 family metallophosphoesterase [Goekera deserti]NDI48752.1 TIGR03767 family metallophosphoesterase [Goekera deserti]NEL54869.1 TIGR03767 family metallophosphoesterase [Goekera deserti]
MSGQHPSVLTTARTLAAGEVLRRGSAADYRALTPAPGERHTVRLDLVPERDAVAAPPGRRPVACFGHVTDLQLADVQSPGRFEFLDAQGGDPRFADLIPMHRPQESLTARAVDAMVRALNGVSGGPVTGAPMELVLTTGDAVDNAQWNELTLFLALLEGGTARPDSGGPGYEGVQHPRWPGTGFWVPDGRHPPAHDRAEDHLGRDHPDEVVARYGFPRLPGLLDDALAAFPAPGLQVPWLGCFGNHEALAQGMGVLTPALGRHLVGSRKPAALAGGLDPDRAVELFLDSPEVFCATLDVPVTPDRGRRPVTRAEFVAAHCSERARPAGHGFTAANLRDGTAHYAWDDGPVRFVCLDTNCLAGGSDGCLDADQLRWLERVLQDSSSRWTARDGGEVRSGAEDRLVVLFSHHGSDRLTHSRGHRGPEGTPLSGAPELLALLHRFPNVVLWVNGHTHVNGIRAHRDPRGDGAGFWEVATCAVADWPSQARVLELADNGDGTLSVLTTMLDHGGPVVPAPGGRRDGPWLAAVHRELAANVPGGGLDSPRAGLRTDRNTDLRLPAPFPLAGLGR